MEQTKHIEHKNNLLKENTEISKKKLLIYELIFLQISNLIKDLRVVLPSDIVLKLFSSLLNSLGVLILLSDVLPSKKLKL